MKDSLKTWRSCIGSFGDIVAYQLLSKTVLSLLLMLLQKLAMLVLASTGRVAVTTGDFMFLFTTWQGVLLLLFGFISLYFYVVIDINTKIVFADKLLKNEKYTLFSLFKDSVSTLPRFFTPGGALVVLFISLLAPLTGVGIYISLTKNLKIPTFISSVIQATPLYRVIYSFAIVLLVAVAVLLIFSIFAIVIDNLKAQDAFSLSRRLILKNWKTYLKQTLNYCLSAAVGGFVAIVVGLVLLVIVACVGADLIKEHERMCVVFLVLLIIAAVALFNFIGSFCYIVRMSRMYYTYQDREDEIPFKQKKGRWLVLPITGFITVALLFCSAFVIDTRFDAIFSNEIPVLIIAHRGGGTEAPENTVEGIRKAIDAGAYGSEIDIQRTADGYYVVNHDGTFSRLCGVNKKPEEMTLTEIKNLVISDPLFPDKPAQVATFEEMVEAAKGKIVLFVELKGNTADQQMVDDAVSIIREHRMQEECVLISLKYDIIDYAETTYPDIRYAYLMFASFGDVASLNCDYLGLEEESATVATVDAIHSQNKKVLVWTPNTESSQRYFLLSEADAIITDNISLANTIVQELKERSDIMMFLDWIVKNFVS
ncbi:MAG: glycerophosphoryl diester phosphodiesterase membrane domain-containing protein [Erysipelotrichaceae bacterium]|nr:glycerophosphoryl diester phosphodiesterase membrane domain-containing protein [Erysipelotrichaceae bacterium]